MPRSSILLAAALALLVLPPDARPAENGRAAETREKLEELRERIEAVRSELAAERRERDRASDELAAIEQRIGRIAGELADLDARMRRQRERLAELADRRAALRERLAGHRGTLAAQLRAAYRLGRQPALRLLLRQDEPGAVARALGYYAYLNDARLSAIEEARSLIEQLGRVEREARAARAELGEQQAELEARREELRGAREERRRLIARLEDSIRDKDERLEQMRASRARLERLLERLDAVLGDIPAAPLEERPFASRQGKLAWPLEGGRVEAGYGERRASGRMRWRGLLVEAEAGTEVRAVYYGRVVFADWLSGFGQLLIIDHLDGYMSLYGFNRRLLRSTGEWVQPGEVIATVGASGGRDAAGLYFEIRRNGEPVDPGPWLAAR